MKIGILTFHYANNYGAVLQAYGLQEVLKSMGHQVEFVDYRNNLIEKRMNYFSLKYHSPFRVCIRLLRNFKDLSRRQKVFNEFRNKYLKVSSSVSSKTLSSTDYGMFVVGSDQVWNPNLTNGLDSVYWGDCSGNIPTIAYAASSNDLFSLSLDEIQQIRKYAKNFAALGVRENRLRDFFEQKFNIHASVVLDPTLLAGHEIFDKITDTALFNEPYLLVYCVENESIQLRDIALKIAHEKKLKLVVISSGVRTDKHFWKDATIITPTISQYLSLIKYANLVVSLSFHGTVFSIIFKKEFYSVKGGNMARVETLLKPLGLMDRIISDVSTIDDVPINYNSVDDMLRNMQDESLKFLLDGLKDISEE